MAQNEDSGTSRRYSKKTTKVPGGFLLVGTALVEGINRYTEDDKD